MPENKVYLSWEQTEELTIQLILKILERGINYDVVFGIARGGLFQLQLMTQVFPAVANSAHLARYGEATESEVMPQIIAWPDRQDFFQKRVLIVDEVWDYGHSIVRAEQAVWDCNPLQVDTAVLHFKPTRNKYTLKRPTYYVAETADWIEYPWMAQFMDKFKAARLQHS